MATPTRCEQAALDLAALKAALVKTAGGQLAEVRQADKWIRFQPGAVNALRDLIRLKQAEVDRCNGVRSRGRFIHSTPSDGC